MSQREEFEKCFERVTEMRVRSPKGLENSYAIVGWKLWQVQAEEIERLRQQVEHLANGVKDGATIRCKLETELWEHKERIAELEQVLQWQPIETAPKDGSNILGFDSNFPSNGAYITWFAEKYGSYQWCSDSTNDFGGWEIPTHWMPLPKPPKALEGKP